VRVSTTRSSEQRSAGKPLKEAATAVGWKHATSRRSTIWDATGPASPLGYPGRPELLKAAFASDKGVDNEAVATRDGGYVWFEVTDVEQARQQSLDEVKGESRSSDAQGSPVKRRWSAKAKELVLTIARR